MESGKTVIGHGQRRQRSLDMAGHFGALAGDAGPTERLDLRGHIPPNKAPTEISERGITSRMSQAMEIR